MTPSTRPLRRRASRRAAALFVTTGLLLAGAAPGGPASAADLPPIGARPVVNQIRFQFEQVDSVPDPDTGIRWRKRFYRNLAYPCSVPGATEKKQYFTFVLASPVDLPATATAKLWVKMHGGGVGYFNAAGEAKPSPERMDEETLGQLWAELDPGLDRNVVQRARQEGTPLRVLLVSMCNHDAYGGGGGVDPNNPHPAPDGTPRTTSGLFATKAAITWTLTKAPTDDYVIYGTSAGSGGALHVAWAMNLQGSPPTAVVADSGANNHEAQLARLEGHVCEPTTDEMWEAAYGTLARQHPTFQDSANQADLVLGRGEFGAPLMHVWSRGDQAACGASIIGGGRLPMDCPLRDGTIVNVWAATCTHLPLQLAIAARPASEHHVSLKLCVNDPIAGQCGTHVATSYGDRSNTSTKDGTPRDYNTVIENWVFDRLADD